MVNNFSDMIDLRNVLIRKSVLGSFDNTLLVVGEIGDPKCKIYKYTKDNTILETSDEDLEHLYREDSNFENFEYTASHRDDKYKGSVTIDARMGYITVDSVSTYDELKPSKKNPKLFDDTKTKVKVNEKVIIAHDFDGKNIYYRILFSTTRIAPIVVFSTESIHDIYDISIGSFFEKKEGDIYNSSLDSLIDVETTKTTIESSYKDIKPKSFDLTYKELNHILNGDYYISDSSGRHSFNSANIYEHYSDNSYEAFYERHNEGLRFKLDGWSQKYIDDDHLKVNVYRTYENIINFKSGPETPYEDPNYTLNKMTSLDGGNDRYINIAKKAISDILQQLLYNIQPQDIKSVIPIEIFMEDGEPDNTKNILIPYHVKQNPNLIHLSGLFPFGNTDKEPKMLSAIAGPNFISIFAEMYVHEDLHDYPIWLVIHYQDPDTGKKYTYKVLYDFNDIVYKDTVEELYTAFMKQDIHTIEFNGYAFRYTNISKTDISGQKVLANKFIYESPEVEFVKETKDNKVEILEFNSSIYNETDNEIFIRSEYGCVIPYSLHNTEV